jgi:transcriptional regulator with XRE-family HTH domain
MTINERLRYLRKDILGLTQGEFGQKINVSASNIGSLELGRIKLTGRLIADVCREWSVSPQWLNEGQEPIFVNDEDPFTSQIIEIYRLLSEDKKKYLKGYIYRLLEEQQEETKP